MADLVGQYGNILPLLYTPKENLVRADGPFWFLKALIYIHNQHTHTLTYPHTHTHTQTHCNAFNGFLITGSSDVTKHTTGHYCQWRTHVHVYTCIMYMYSLHGIVSLCKVWLQTCVQETVVKDNKMLKTANLGVGIHLQLQTLVAQHSYIVHVHVRTMYWTFVLNICTEHLYCMPPTNTSKT